MGWNDRLAGNIYHVIYQLEAGRQSKQVLFQRYFMSCGSLSIPR